MNVTGSLHTSVFMFKKVSISSSCARYDIAFRGLTSLDGNQALASRRCSIGSSSPHLRQPSSRQPP